MKKILISHNNINILPLTFSAMGNVRNKL